MNFTLDGGAVSPKGVLKAPTSKVILAALRAYNNALASIKIGF
jgi:hypothetical protein